MALTVRNVAFEDESQWAELYRGYHDFYKRDQEERIYETLFSWLMDPDHEVRGLVAELDGKIIGFAHYRTFARPIMAGSGIFLDDLFTNPELRRTGAATALLEKLQEIAADEGATVVRWITADDNETARSLYDAKANLTAWATYDMAPKK